MTPEKAALDALERGEELNTVKTESGEEFTQRPVTLDMNAPRKRTRKKAGTRVRVYNKENGWLFATDCKIPPKGEANVLRSDLDRYPVLKARLLVMG